MVTVDDPDADPRPRCSRGRDQQPATTTRSDPTTRAGVPSGGDRPSHRTSGQVHGQSTTRRLATTWVTRRRAPRAGGRALPAEHEPGRQVERQHPDPVGAHVHDREQHRRADQGPDGAGRRQEPEAEAPEERLLGHGGERAGEDEGQARRRGRVAAADGRPMAKAATPTRSRRACRPSAAQRRADGRGPRSGGSGQHAPATSSATNSPTSTAPGWFEAATSAGRAPSNAHPATTTTEAPMADRSIPNGRVASRAADHRPPPRAAGGDLGRRDRGGHRTWNTTAATTRLAKGR